jgi:hypothetical protein
MENLDSVSGALLDAAAGSTFEDHDDGFGEPVPFRCRTNSFHERSGCSRSIAPPPRRSRPDHVGGIDEKHYPSLADPRPRPEPWVDRGQVVRASVKNE